MEFYGSQAETYAVYLSNAIDAFILTIEHSQPPKVFVAYSKFVILNAHKLLCIGDTVHRNVDNVKLKASVLERSNQLCQVKLILFKKKYKQQNRKLKIILFFKITCRACKHAYRVQRGPVGSSQVSQQSKRCSTRF